MHSTAVVSGKCGAWGRRAERGRLNVLAQASTPNHVSLDVEYAHYRIEGTAERLYPAEVCLVDWNGDLMYHSYCQTGLSRPGENWSGGTPIRSTQDASALELVSADVKRIIEGRVLVGHGLRNDLMSLDIEHPPNLLRDTLHIRHFQRKNGHAHSLKQLAKTHLGLTIQRGLAVHSAREDAEAVMKLYRHMVLEKPAEAVTHEEMVEVFLFLWSMQKESNKKMESQALDFVSREAGTPILHT